MTTSNRTATAAAPATIAMATACVQRGIGMLAYRPYPVSAYRPLRSHVRRAIEACWNSYAGSKEFLLIRLY